jgi:hypothetical protein
MSTRRHGQWLLPVVVIFVITLACGGTTSVAPVQPADSEVTQAPQAESTQPPSVTAIPTTTPTAIPTAVPTEPAYREPLLLGEVGGEGSTVTDNLQLPACGKAVFQWNVAPTRSGSASLILSIHRPDRTDSVTLVNEFAMDVGTGGLSGSSLQTLLGGEYYFTSENTDQAWTLRIECQDGVAPVAQGIDLDATGNIVTQNYSLPACHKSVFDWTAARGSGGSAALILSLCGNDCVTIVNEFQMDLAEDMTGQSLQPVDGGIYYLVSENTGGRAWGVHWTCGD